MKTHLFIAHSNLHLMFAQAIAASLPADCRKVLWISAQKADSKLYDLYDLVLIDGVWSEIERVDYYRRMVVGSFGQIVRKPGSSVKHLKAAIGAMEKALSALEGEVEVWVAHPYSWDTRLAAKWGAQRKLPVHFYEEGISIYLDRTPVQYKLSRTEKGRRLAIKAILAAIGRSYLNQPMDSSLQDVWKNYPQVSSLFSPPLPAQHLSAKFNQAYLEKLLENERLRGLVEQAASAYPKEKFVLFISSVEVEDNMVNEEDYLKAVIECLSTPQLKDLPVCIKPHPRNKPEILESLIQSLGSRAQIIRENTPVPLELLATHLSSALVLGVCSSPLIYLPLLYGIKTISLSHRLVNARLGPQGARIVQFSEQFGKIVEGV